MKTISTKIVLIICAVALASGLGIAAAVVPIWSNIISINVTAVPVWQGTITLTSNVQTTTQGQSVTIIATLSPTPTTPQAVTFYFSELPNANENTPLSADPHVGFAVIGGSTNPVTTIGNTAQISCTLGTIDTYYFRAEVLNPA